MAFTLTLSSSLPPHLLKRAVVDAPAAWQPSRLPEELRDQGIYALTARATTTRFVLRLRSQRYPAPLLAQVRGAIAPGKAPPTRITIRVALPLYRVWQQLALAGLGFWAGHIAWLGYVLGSLALLRAGQYLQHNAQLTLETPSARYLLKELGQLLEASG